MSKGIVETIGGAVMVAAGVAADILTAGAAAPLAQFLISAGAGLLITGIGTLLSKGPQKGFATTERNPTAPWSVIYGRARVGGTLVYIADWGTNNKWLDMVIVLAAHKCQNVDEVLFDNCRLQIGAHNTSFSPVWQTVNITAIARVNNVVTVTLAANIPLLQDGDQVQVTHNQSGGILDTYGATGIFAVTIISQTPGGPGSITFSYLSGGVPFSVNNEGQVQTKFTNNGATWADYGANVYFEAMLGSQTLGTTFVGMTSGTPAGGDTGNIVNNNPQPWTPYCSGVGKTLVMLRLQYVQSAFPSGIPQVSFHVSGKNDIYDPRTSLSGYSENAALCIADYLSNTIWGFKAVMGTDIPYTPLIAAANICDEAVAINPVMSPPNTEPRYTCNGQFNLTMKRGEVLQNLLTSCAGRLTFSGGQYVIWPASWAGISATLASDFLIKNAAGSFRWRPTVSISNLYNGVKGTYVSPVNKWQSSDFPYYAQDDVHGYSNGPSMYNYDQNLADDGGDRRWKDIQLPFTISCPTAQRLAKIELMRLRQQGTGTFPLNMAGYQFVPMDVIQAQYSYFGWTNKQLEILAHRFTLSKQNLGGQDVTLLGTEIDVQEAASSVYAWSIGEELSPAGYQQAITPATATPDPPTNLQISAGIPILTWTPPTDAYVLNGGYIAARYMLITSPPGLWISLGQIDPSITSLALTGLTAGEQYIVELRSVNVGGIPSSWVSINTMGAPEFQWAPYQVQAPASDALFPNEWTFDLAQSYAATSGTDWSATSTAKGNFPINSTIPSCPQPVLTALNVSISPTGGTIPGGVYLDLAITANNAAGVPTLPSAILTLAIPIGTNTNSVTIRDAPAAIQGTFSINPSDGNAVNISGKLYQFQTSLTNVDGNVLIGANLAASLQNLQAAVNLGGGSGSLYAAATTANPNSTITAVSGTNVICSAITAGPSGNALTASGIAQWLNGGNFSGGANFTWPAVTGLTGYTIYASIIAEDLTCGQATGTLTPTGGGSTYTPTSITLTGVAQARSTYALPNPIQQLIRIKGALLIHGGVEGAEVDSVSAYTIVASECIDLAGTDNWTGRVVAIIGRNNASAPFVSFNCTAFNPATGSFTFSQDPVAAGVQVGDALVVCTLGVSNTGNPLVITDSGLSNAQDEPTPHAGLVVNDPKLIGATVLVIKGISRGATAHIVSNTATSLTLDQPILIDATSVWVVIGSTWLYKQDSLAITNTNVSQPVSIAMQVDNAVGGSILVAGFAVDNQGNEALIDNAPVRMQFIWGAGMAETTVAATYQMLPTDQVVYMDCTAGPFTVTLPPSSIVRNSPRWIQKIDTTANVGTIQGYGGTETIGSTGNTTMTLNVQGDSLTLLPNNI